MLARQSKQLMPSIRLNGSHFSVLVATEEFPHKPVPRKAATPAVVQQQTLDNGVRVITKNHDSPIVSLKFAVLGGSGTESATQKGAAHFLSVAAYAGSNKKSGVRIVRELEGLGAKFSATADREKVVYDVSVLADNVGPAFSTVINAIGSAPHSNYVLDEVRSTAQVLYAEHSSCQTAQVTDLIHEAAFGETSALGNNGFALNLNSLSTSNILEYRNNNFVRENLVVSANGISVDALKKLFDANASHGVPSGKNFKAIADSPYVGGDVKVRVDLNGRTNLAVAFPFATSSSGKSAEVLHALLTSRLAAKKVCATPFIHQYTKSGLLGLHTFGSVEEAAKNLEAAVNELKSIVNSASDADAIKVKVSLDKFAALENGSVADSLLQAFLRGEDAVKAADVRSVSAQNVSETAAKMLKSTPTYVVYGATAGTPTYSSIQKLIA